VNRRRGSSYDALANFLAASFLLTSVLAVAIWVVTRPATPVQNVERNDLPPIEANYVDPLPCVDDPYVKAVAQLRLDDGREPIVCAGEIDAERTFAVIAEFGGDEP
jgi:hypothetical protein